MSRCVGWVLWPLDSKWIVGWTDSIGISSSDALWFGYNMGQGSALKHRTIWRLDHQFIWWLHLNQTETRQLNCFSTRWTDTWIEDSAVHLTVVFKSHSTAPSVESSAPDEPTGRRCIALVHCLGFLVQRLYWALWDTEWYDALQGGPSVHLTVLLF
jgi:hypothetical protein